MSGVLRRHVWDGLTSSYWFVPTLMTIGGGGLAVALTTVDRNHGNASSSWLYSGGADGAKTLLSTVAGSTITVAGVVFSITIAALTQASAQFGPRLLRSFMRDTSNQIVLGTFVATFLYCLLVLRTIHGKLDEGTAFVPQTSVSVGVLLAIASIAVLIYFIHHVSIALQAPSVVAAVRNDFFEVLRDAPGARDVHAAPASAVELANACVGSGLPVPAHSDGYIQAVDFSRLIEFAAATNTVVVLASRPGHHAIEGTPIAHVWPADRCPPDAAVQVARGLIYGDHRTSEQDIEYAVTQIVEVAVRALSPGINDPFTAINCIDALGAALARAARTGLPPAIHRDASGTVRLIVPITTFAGLADVAFNQIRQYGRGSVAVTLRLLESITACASQLTTGEHRSALMNHARMIFHQSQDRAAYPEAHDREEARKRWTEVSSALIHAGDAPPSPDLDAEPPR